MQENDPNEIAYFTFMGLTAGVIFLVILVKVLRSGEVNVYSGKVRRDDHPLSYWLAVTTIIAYACFYACLGLFAAVLGE